MIVAMRKCTVEYAFSGFCQHAIVRWDPAALQFMGDIQRARATELQPTRAMIERRVSPQIALLLMLGTQRSGRALVFGKKSFYLPQFVGVWQSEAEICMPGVEYSESLGGKESASSSHTRRVL